MERKTLLLSANYIPVQILHWQECVKLVYEGNADVLVEYDEEIRGVSVTWKWPAVIRLRRQGGKRKKRAVRFSRAAVYMRDGYKCQYCGNKFQFSALTMDHVIPRARGGQTEYCNVVSCCGPCNSAKGDKSCDQWGKWPLKKPVVPAFMPEPGPRIDPGNLPDEWKGFVSAE